MRTFISIMFLFTVVLGAANIALMVIYSMEGNLGFAMFQGLLLIINGACAAWFAYLHQNW